MPKIKIQGDTRQFDLEEVEDSVIKLSNQYFWRSDSERVTRIANKDGKKRYYRVKSPLICKSVTDGAFHLKEDCTLTNDGLWLIKNHPDTIKIGDKYYQSKFTTLIDGKPYLLHDPKITKVLGGGYALKTNVLPLSNKYYSSLSFNKDHIGRTVIKTFDNHYIKKSDAREYFKGGQIEFIHVSDTKGLPRVGYEFTDRLRPSTRGMKICFVSKKTRVVESEILGIPLIADLATGLEDLYSAFVEKEKRASIEKVRKACNDTYSEAGKDENNAKIISLDYRRFPGNEVLYRPSKQSIDISKSLSLTGGMGYTFGVEFETSAGLLPDLTCGKAGLTKVGDGSIGAAEYVTAPLHGNNGVEKLKQAAKMLSEGTFVDDRCALHIHIGTAKGAAPLEFSDMYMVKAVALGAKIEKDLFDICPSSRSPVFKHCHSIIRYKDINKDNYKPLLGHYIFGNRESWSNRFNTKGFSYGNRDQDRNTSLGLYCGGRYKWLNLVNCGSRANHKTIENRIFAGTTSFDKVYNYLLITMAFAHYCNVQSSKVILGKTKITLKDVIKFSIKDTTLQASVIKFLDARTKKFKRKDIYKDLKDVTQINDDGRLEAVPIAFDRPVAVAEAADVPNFDDF